MSSTSGMAQATNQMEVKNDYDGKFLIGVVVDNMDPEKAERVRIRIPNLLGPEIPDSQLPWARPVKDRVRGPTTGNHSFSVPVVGAKLIVVLQNGDPYHPLYLGGLLTPEDVAAVFQTNYPHRYGVQDNKGNHLYVDTQTGDVDIKHSSGLVLHIAPSGAMTINSPSTMVANFGGNVRINAPRIDLN